MNNLIKYELKEMPRSTTRGQWELISRWLRECANHVSPLLQKAIHNLLVCGIYPKEIERELSLVKRTENRFKDKAPVAFNENRNKLIEYFMWK